MERIAYIGIDVHKDTNASCLFFRDQKGNPSFYEIGTIPAGVENMIKAIRKAVKNLDIEDYELLAGYEAGPTGYGLCKGLQKKGVNCIIMAPTTIKKSPGDKTKTDRKDAKMLSIALATDAYKKVHLIDEEDECTREFTRARTALKGHLKKSKQQLLSFLLRVGITYPDTGNYWTKKFFAWIGTLHFADPKLNYAFNTYLTQVKDLTDKIRIMDAQIEAIAKEDRYKDKVDKLVCFGGIETHTALSIVCEIGDFNRFNTAKDFSSYLGLVPGQDSSGKQTKYTGITKTGNSRVRFLLVEATKGIRRASPFSKSWRIKKRQLEKSPEIVAYADKGTKRIKAKMNSLVHSRGKNANVATAAGARELACFVWGMMTDNIG
jgi:transposase